MIVQRLLHPIRKARHEFQIFNLHTHHRVATPSGTTIAEDLYWSSRLHANNFSTLPASQFKIDQALNEPSYGLAGSPELFFCP